MSMKTWYVIDKETGYILSGYMCCDNPEDGYNPFTRPYKYPEYHSPKDHCDLDYIFRTSIEEGLKTLKRENLLVLCTKHPPYNNEIEFIKNPNYFYERYATRGWWKLKSF